MARHAVAYCGKRCGVNGVANVVDCTGKTLSDTGTAQVLSVHLCLVWCKYKCEQCVVQMNSVCAFAWPNLLLPGVVAGQAWYVWWRGKPGVAWQAWQGVSAQNHNLLPLKWQHLGRLGFDRKQTEMFQFTAANVGFLGGDQFKSGQIKTHFTKEICSNVADPKNILPSLKNAKHLSPNHHCIE